MRMFVVHIWQDKPANGEKKDAEKQPVQTAVVEVEIEVIKGMEDPSVLWLPPYEYKARVIKQAMKCALPEDIWCSHCFYPYQREALLRAKSLIREDFEFNKRKHGVIYTEADVLKKYTQIKELSL